MLRPMRFVTGGCDNLVKIWGVDEKSFSDDLADSQFGIGGFKIKETLNEHTDWVRDVTWLNYVGYAYDTIASCSEV